MESSCLASFMPLFLCTYYLLSRAGVMDRQIANFGRPFQRENRNLSSFACRVRVGVAVLPSC